ncbi:ATP-binding protein [Streptomyces sp. CBMA152]|uniref:ATP-binding protein n=1 Tax=Streptomyces sp. CBMA152 TaxID=1896312 RepID=UPI001660EAF9|nr:ATP-binding protein [Streptomyces sp. CBMA152]MBD0745767.1 ATPase [Streptomyces sp. CBMA152]
MNENGQPLLVTERFWLRERQSVRAAREFSRRAIDGWGIGGRADDVLLCVSELTTNALIHGVPPGRGYLLRLALYAGGLLRVEVHDSGGGTPRVPESADEGGRGLLLVAAVADKWGVGERRPGKVVWCEFGPRMMIGGTAGGSQDHGS